MDPDNKSKYWVACYEMFLHNRMKRKKNLSILFLIIIKDITFWYIVTCSENMQLNHELFYVIISNSQIRFKSIGQVISTLLFSIQYRPIGRGLQKKSCHEISEITFLTNSRERKKKYFFFVFNYYKLLLFGK